MIYSGDESVLLFDTAVGIAISVVIIDGQAVNKAFSSEKLPRKFFVTAEQSIYAVFTAFYAINAVLANIIHRKFGIRRCNDGIGI